MKFIHLRFLHKNFLTDSDCSWEKGCGYRAALYFRISTVFTPNYTTLPPSVLVIFVATCIILCKDFHGIPLKYVIGLKGHSHENV
jgi:hypothetical protein